MAVTLPSVYRDGTATIAANGAVVIGQSTLWVNAVLPGDFFGTHKGFPIRIASVDSNTQLTLAYAWPGGAQTAAAYEIMLQSDNARMQETSRQLLQSLSNGNLTAFAGLTGVADGMPYFTGAGAMAIAPGSAFSRSLLAGTSAAAIRATLGLGTAATQNTGTSGATIPLLSTANTWSGIQTFGSGAGAMNVVINSGAGASAAMVGQKAGSTRWTAILGNGTAETGSNAGTDLTINRYDDGGAFLGTALTIARATGVMSLGAPLPIASGGMGVNNIAAFKTSLAYGTAANQNIGTSGATVPLLNGANNWSNAQVIIGNLLLGLDGTAAQNRGMSFTTSGSARWRVFANNIAEAGSNVGSNFIINAYDDAGAFLSTPLQINRATGSITLSSPLPLASGGLGANTAAGGRTSLGLGTAATVNTGTSGAVIPLLSAANTWSGIQTFGAGSAGVDARVILDSGNNTYFEGRKLGSIRWQMFLGNSEAEGGSNAGSNFILSAFGDAGAGLGRALTINRSDRIVQATTGIATPNINGGPLSDFRNKIINGNFDIWQRGTAFTTNAYSADRWISGNTGTTKTTSRQSHALGQNTIPGNPEFFIRNVVSSVAGSGNNAYYEQRIEGVETLSGTTATVTWYAKADAARPMSMDIMQYFGSGGSPSAAIAAIGATKVTLSTGWQKFTAVVSIPSISGKTLGTDGLDRLSLRFWFDAGSSFDATTVSLGQQSGTFDISRVSIVQGDASGENDAFSPRHVGTELALCQRYYEIVRAGGWLGYSAGTGLVGSSLCFKVTKRAVPSAGNISWTSTGNVGAQSVNNLSVDGCMFQLTVSATGTGFMTGISFPVDCEI
ncbi:hypothetical protein G6M04_16395 [Agrobacterium rhizogenes]|uniref:beta strand repeat-containing protein n=1 Tax=Rhizobium rhizogenes TaxID=359 RepID=UPI0015739E8D|nr:hypothetical protein [Rhizobium rhizogenes]NTG48958.1 hypothetical protein [Rhizobium rhizogenes]